jgi:hypothetical protein
MNTVQSEIRIMINIYIKAERAGCPCACLYPVRVLGDADKDVRKAGLGAARAEGRDAGQVPQTVLVRKEVSLDWYNLLCLVSN